MGGMWLIGFMGHVGSVALDVGRAACHAHTKVVLSNNLHSKVVFLDVDVRTGPDGFHQTTLYLSSRVVGMVKDAELGVTAFPVQVELSVILAVKVDTPLYELLYLLRSHAYHLLYGLPVTDVVAGYHRVLYVLVEVVNLQVGHRCHAALCKRGVGLVETCFANYTHTGTMLPSLRGWE
jgi:hypothetical protein